jgi:hypothetical protein
MKTGNKFHTHFEKATPRTKEEIKAAAEKVQSTEEDFDIRSNGNHIWVELGEKKQQYWSPMLHLRLVDSEDKTCIKGEFAENPLLWLAFIVTQIASALVFLVALIVAYFKYDAGWNFNAELFLMFAMVTVWFAIHLVSENFRKKGKRQIEKLHQFVDHIAAA